MEFVLSVLKNSMVTYRRINNGLLKTQPDHFGTSGAVWLLLIMAQRHVGMGMDLMSPKRLILTINYRLGTILQNNGNDV